MPKLEEDINDSLRILSEIDSFPNNCCKFAALTMRKKGYPIKVGIVHLNNYCNMGIKKDLEHCWNYDLETNTNFDITAEQLNIHLKNENKIPNIYSWKNTDSNSIYSEIKIVPDSQNLFLL